MKQIHVMVGLMLLLCSLFSQAQQNVATNTNVVVPPLVNFSGVLTDLNGKPLTGVVGVTFLLYKDSEGGAPLWMETQNVQPDKTGHYTVVLGSTSSTGLPADIFVAGEAHWLGLQVQGLGQAQEERPRVLLVSAPYALKAGDAQTLGGLPASAFVLAAPSNGSSLTVSHNLAKLNSAISPDVSGTGTTDYIPLWTNSTGGLGNSVLFQSGTKIGINTTTPATALDVKGAITATGLITGRTGTFSANSSSTAVNITQSGSGDGLYVNAPSGYYGLYVNGDAVGAEGNALATGGDGVIGSSTGGRGVYGIDNATSGSSVGLYGQTNSSTGYGVEGTSPYVGVYGQSSDASGIHFASGDIGVWGDTGGAASCCIGVGGTADDNNAGAFINNSVDFATLYAENLGSSGGSSLVFYTYGKHYGGVCYIDVSGNLKCSGSVSDVVSVDGGARKVSLYATQSTENWFEDFGSGTLANGAASVALDPTFAQTVNTTTGYHVFLTPRGECEGLYVANLTRAGFEVRELHHGSSSVAFDYRMVAKRIGYENARLADVTERYQKMEQQQELHQERMKQRRTAGSATGPIAAAAATPHN